MAGEPDGSDHTSPTERPASELPTSDQIRKELEAMVTGPDGGVGTPKYLALSDFLDFEDAKSAYLIHRDIVLKGKAGGQTTEQIEWEELLALRRLKFANVSDRASQRSSEIPGYDSAYNRVSGTFGELVGALKREFPTNPTDVTLKEGLRSIRQIRRKVLASHVSAPATPIPKSP